MTAQTATRINGLDMEALGRFVDDIKGDAS
jgi:hypothetical protein